MTNRSTDIFKLPTRILFLIASLDIIRGFMHTFLLTWSATNIAQLDITATSNDQIFLLGVFGISNFLTGFIYFIIAKKARKLSPYILILIPLTYLLGLCGIWHNGIHAKAQFDGQYFMYVYFSICIITFIIFLIQKHKSQ